MNAISQDMQMNPGTNAIARAPSINPQLLAENLPDAPNQDDEAAIGAERGLKGLAKRILSIHSYDPRWEKLQRDHQKRAVARYMTQTGWTGVLTIGLVALFVGAGEKTWLIYLAFLINLLSLAFGFAFMPGVGTEDSAKDSIRLGASATYATLMGIAIGWSIFFFTAMAYVDDDWHGIAVGMSVGVVAMGGMGCSAYPLLSLGFMSTVALGGSLGVQVSGRPLADYYAYAWAYMVILLYIQHHFRSRGVLKNVRDAAELEASQDERRQAVESQHAAERKLLEGREQDRLREEQERLKKNEARKKEFIELAAKFETTIGDVSASVATAARQFSLTAKSMTKQASDAFDQIEQIAASMDQVAHGSTAAAAASDEFSISIDNVSEQAASAAHLARAANDTAKATDESVVLLKDRAEGIGEIVQVINTIASRTRLLAINASIEASRGGGAGRGFGVVATEVKDLAGQTKDATGDVASKITEMQQRTKTSAKELAAIREQIGVLETAADSIATAMDQQAHASKNLAESIDLAASGAGEVSAATQELRKAAGAIDEASEQLSTASDDLETQAELLKEQVADFLDQIRNL